MIPRPWAVGWGTQGTGHLETGNQSEKCAAGHHQRSKGKSRRAYKMRDVEKT